jgi:hypothetical protein
MLSTNVNLKLVKYVFRNIPDEGEENGRLLVFAVHMLRQDQVNVSTQMWALLVNVLEHVIDGSHGRHGSKPSPTPVRMVSFQQLIHEFLRQG